MLQELDVGRHAEGLDRQTVASIPALRGDPPSLRQTLGLFDPTPSGSPVAIGDTLDADVPLHPLPDEFKALRPYFSDLLYAVVGETAVLVFPATRRVMMTY